MLWSLEANAKPQLSLFSVYVLPQVLLRHKHTHTHTKYLQSGCSTVCTAAAWDTISSCLLSVSLVASLVLKIQPLHYQPPPPLPALPPSLPPCLLSSHCVSLFQRLIRGRGGEARVGGTLIQGVLLTSAGREWCHCDVNACNCNRAAKLTGVHSDSERELRGKREKEEEETL